MLKKYKNIEPLVYMQMKKAIEKNLSHAYLFNLNDNIYSEAMIKDFIKNIMCKEHETEEEYKLCSLCKRIDEGNYPELKIIQPDGLWIKKEQLDELQSEFSMKSIESNKRVYMIYETERLNKNSANSLLKFLEDPKDGVIAILLTNNINLVMETILSRCQIITFNKNKVEDYIEYNKIKKDITLNKIMYSVFSVDKMELITEENKEFLNNILKFIKKYEEIKEKTIITLKTYVLDYLDEKEKLAKFFECLILFYRDVLIYKEYKKVNYFEDYMELIDSVNKKNDLHSLLNKIETIIKSEKLIRSNANTELLIDKMLIDMEE